MRNPLAAQDVSDFGSTTRCVDCGVFIGEGHAEVALHGEERHPEPLCLACCRSAQRRASGRRPW